MQARHFSSNVPERKKGDLNPDNMVTENRWICLKLHDLTLENVSYIP